MITGGVASVLYGDPRFTRDPDLVMELREVGVRLSGGIPAGWARVPAPPYSDLNATIGSTRVARRAGR